MSHKSLTPGFRHNIITCHLFYTLSILVSINCIILHTVHIVLFFLTHTLSQTPSSLCQHLIITSFDPFLLMELTIEIEADRRGRLSQFIPGDHSILSRILKGNFGDFEDHTVNISIFLFARRLYQSVIR